MRNIKTVKKLPTNEEIIAAHPLDEKCYANIDQDKKEVRDILSGDDNRLLIVIGPCSAWPFDAMLEYAEKFKALSEKVSDSLKLVLRVYVQKPRTTKGWTGPVSQPDPFSAPDIAAGAMYARSLMVKLIELGLPIADEALFTHNAKGFIELLSWVAIGARSTEDQEHRIFASGIDCPVGMKNPTSGSIQVGVNSVIAAQTPRTAAFDGYQIETKGNPFAHLVLRGGVKGQNFHLYDLLRSRDKLLENGVANPAIMIDASHDNCRVNGHKDYELQIDVVREVLNNLEVRPELQDFVKGFMLESFLKDGNQNIDKLTPETVDMEGLSVTDPCLGWDKTETLILDIAEKFRTIRK